MEIPHRAQNVGLEQSRVRVLDEVVQRRGIKSDTGHIRRRPRANEDEGDQT